MKELPKLSPLEHSLLEILWKCGPSTVEEISAALPARARQKDSTIRTVMSRLEAKKAVRHDVDGRANRYRPTIQPHELGNRSLRRLLDTFFKGSVESMLVGMVDEEMVTEEELTALARRIVARRSQRKGERS